MNIGKRKACKNTRRQVGKHRNLSYQLQNLKFIRMQQPTTTVPEASIWNMEARVDVGKYISLKRNNNK